jgi:hypothetical protein
MATLLEDAQKAAAWIRMALVSSGYKADFSLESLREIDRFFDEHCKEGRAVPGGLLSAELGSRIFALGSYVGEVIIRAYGGKWQTADDDPEGELNIKVVLLSGAIIWPVQRVMKRFKNSPEDGIYAYGRLANG